MYMYIYIYYDWTAFCPAFGARRELRTKFHSQIEWFFVPLLLGCLKHTCIAKKVKHMRHIRISVYI